MSVFFTLLPKQNKTKQNKTKQNKYILKKNYKSDAYKFGTSNANVYFVTKAIKIAS